MNLRAILHYILIMVGVVFWSFGNWCYVGAMYFAIMANKLMPNSKYGNCWSYALPKWHENGGYLQIRPADGQRFLKFEKLGIKGFIVPHVLWVQKFPSRGVVLSQFVPVKRKTAQVWPWHTTYYKGVVRHVEAKHPEATVPFDSEIIPFDDGRPPNE